MILVRIRALKKYYVLQMDEWIEVLQYYPRIMTCEYTRGIIQSISESTEYATVFFPQTDDISYVHMKWVERFGHMLGSVQECTAFRIEVLIQQAQIMTYIVSVNPKLFLSQIEHQNILGEHHIIMLTKNLWKLSVTHSLEFKSPTEHMTDEHCNDAQEGIWNNDMVLLPHQDHSLNFMKCVESKIRNKEHCEYNNRVIIPSTGFFIDLMSESFVQEVDVKSCKVRGGYLCDEVGSGKTVVSLKLISDMTKRIDSACKIHNPNKHNYCSKATLIIVSNNLPGQWCDEISKFYRQDSYTVLRFWQKSDMKNVSMQDLLNADIVITTFSFIKANKYYNECFHSVIGENEKKSRALFNMVARRRNVDLPILQLAKWDRIIVDEIHEYKGRDLKILKCFTCEVMWGLTATPNLKVHLSDDLNDLNFMFEEVGPYHPNLYAEFVKQYMRGYQNISNKFPTNDLKLVKLSDVERSKFDYMSREDMILHCTSLNDTVTCCGNSSDLDTLMLNHEEQLIEKNADLLANEVKNIVTTCMILTAIWCVDKLQNSVVKKAQLSIHMKAILYQQTQSIESMARLKDTIYNAKRKKLFMEDNLKRLEKRTEICPICMDSSCSVITKCGHLFCMDCIAKHLQSCEFCPNCRHTSDKTNIFRVICDDESSKINAIKDVARTLKEPTLILAQWKKVLRDIKISLSNQGFSVFLLEGNVSQRASVLNDFKQNGGILLVCAADSFAGIRLPNLKHIIFSHALLGNYHQVRSIELQTIGRALHISAGNNVHVMSFIAADSQEEIQWRINHP